MALIRQSVLAATSAIVLTGSRFAFMAILSRKLPVADFGRFAYAQWLVDLSLLVCSVGINAVASRYFAELRAKPDLLAVVAKFWRPLSIAVASIAALVTVGVCAWLGIGTTSAELLALLAWSFASGLWTLQMSALTGLQRFERLLLANIAAALVLVSGAALLPPGGNAIAGVFFLSAAASVCAGCFAINVVRTLIAGRSNTNELVDWRGLRRYAVNMWITALLWSLVWSRGEWPLVKSFVGDVGIARYAAATTLFGGAVQGTMLAVAGLAPQLTLLWGRGQIGQAMQLSRKVMEVQLLISGVLSILLVTFGTPLLALAFGATYREAGQTLALMVLGLPALAWACHNHMLQLATDARFTRDVTFLGLLVLYLLAVWCVPQQGIDGAAFARAATMWFMSLMSLLMVTRRFGHEVIPWRNLAIVSATLLGVLIVTLIWRDLALTLRMLLFATASGILIFGVRDVRGVTAWAWWHRRLESGAEELTASNSESRA